jgi:hypothetical protein
MATMAQIPAVSGAGLENRRGPGFRPPARAGPVRYHCPLELSREKVQPWRAVLCPVENASLYIAIGNISRELLNLCDLY